MKRILFFTILFVWLSTTVVTLLGITNVLTISESYLKLLVPAFLVGVGGAILTIFKSGDFFSDETKKLENEIQKLMDQNAQKDERIGELGLQTVGLSEQIESVNETNKQLSGTIDSLESLRLEIIGLLASDTATPSMILSKLNRKQEDQSSIMSVLGKLVEDDQIEPNPLAGGHYRLKKK